MNILIGTILIWGAAVFAVRHLQRTAPAEMPQLWRKARRTFVFMLPRVLAGLLGAGFLAALLPAQLVDRWFGAEAGLTGILLATLFGAVTPGGPFVAFAIGASAIKAGAGAGALVAYVSAWSVVCLLRTISYEVPLMGIAFTRTRLLATLPAPVALGVAAHLVGRLWA